MEQEEIIHLDFLGNKIKVGDKVVALSHRDTSSRFLKRTVIKITNCFIRTEDKLFPPEKIIVIERKNGKKLFELDNK